MSRTAAETAGPPSSVKTIAIVLNPASGRGQGGRRRKELERLLASELARTGESKSIHWEILETSRAGGGTEAAARALRAGAEIVAAAGGDGTYGEVVNGIAGTGAKLAVLPLGTGNDFSRALGLGTDLAAAVRTLFSGRPKPIDLGRCGDRYFVNVAGCGFD